VHTLVEGLNAGKLPDDVEVVISPPALYLGQVRDLIRKEIAVSGQNCYHQDGAFTGEVTASMLKDLGLPWVILGHSERRTIFKESDELIGAKVAKCLEVGLKVIACIGEQLSEREEGKTTEVVFAQLRAIANNVHDPNETKIVYVRATGGEMGATSTLAPKVGPLGLNAKKVGEDIMKATKEWKGLRVTVKLTIKNRQATAEIVPSSTSLVLRALKEPPRDRKKVKHIKHDGNITLEEIIDIARIMRPRSMARELRGTVKEILGTAFSVGCTVEGRMLQRWCDCYQSYHRTQGLGV